MNKNFKARIQSIVAANGCDVKWLIADIIEHIEGVEAKAKVLHTTARGIFQAVGDLGSGGYFCRFCKSKWKRKTPRETHPRLSSEAGVFGGRDSMTNQEKKELFYKSLQMTAAMCNARGLSLEQASIMLKEEMVCGGLPAELKDKVVKAMESGE